MTFLYDTFDYLPEVAQRPVVALLIIVIGYFLSKIFAAFLSVAIPENDGLNLPTLPDSVLSPRSRIVRSCFWFSWLVFIIIGFNQLPLLSSAMKLWVIVPANFPVQFLIGLGGGLLLAMDKNLARLIKVIWGFFSSKIPLEINGVFRFMLRIVWIPFVVIGGWALNDPQSIGLKVVATVMVLVLGYIVGKVVKVTTTSLIGIEMPTNHPVPKFVFYCVCTTFLIAAIDIWT